MIPGQLAAGVLYDSDPRLYPALQRRKPSEQRKQQSPRPVQCLDSSETQTTDPV